MKVVSKRLLMLALGVALAGCSAGDAAKKQPTPGVAPQKTSAPPATSPPATSVASAKPVTAANLDAGKYVASLEGMS
jgi:hypothetical protein